MCFIQISNLARISWAAAAALCRLRARDIRIRHPVAGDGNRGL